MHGALSCFDDRQGAEPEGDHPRDAQLSERTGSAERGGAAGGATARDDLWRHDEHGGSVRVYDLRLVRVPMPGRHSTSADHHRAAPGRDEYWRVGGQLWDEALPCA